MASNTSEECASTVDCVTQNAAKECYTDVFFTDDSSFCGCSNFYGWVGEDCDQASSQLIYARMSSSLLCLWAVLVFVLTMQKLFHVCNLKKSTTESNSQDIIGLT